MTYRKRRSSPKKRYPQPVWQRKPRGRKRLWTFITAIIALIIFKLLPDEGMQISEQFEALSKSSQSAPANSSQSHTKTVATKNRACPTQPFLLKTPQGYDHYRFAPQPNERLYDGGSFVASLDDVDDDDKDGKPDLWAQPTWVAMHLKANFHQQAALGWERPSPWYDLELFNLEREFFNSEKIIDDSYRGSGKQWNRGHLGRRADANRLGPQYGCDSHVFANAVPQNALLNQGIWSALENRIGEWADTFGEVWIISGPVYHQGKISQTVGDIAKQEIPVAVPDALFKVIYFQNKNQTEVISFIYPNRFTKKPAAYKTGDCSHDHSYDHSSFIVDVKEIEKQTGLKFSHQATSLKVMPEVQIPDNVCS